MSLTTFTTVFACGYCGSTAQAWTDTCADGVRLRYEYAHKDGCPDIDQEQP